MAKKTRKKDEKIDLSDEPKDPMEKEDDEEVIDENFSSGKIKKPGSGFHVESGDIPESLEDGVEDLEFDEDEEDEDGWDDEDDEEDW